MLVGYARVSTNEQDASLQHDALVQAGCERVFTDKSSGARADRLELRRALDIIREGDLLVCWRLDRLARSVTDLIEIVRTLETDGVGLRSLTEAIDTTTGSGKLTFHIFAALAEFERNLIRERTRAGLDAARRRGRIGGRPRSMTADKLEAAKRLLNSGMPARDVASTIGVSIPTLYRHLPGRQSARSGD